MTTEIEFKDKLKTLRQQLIGARYFNALSSLEFAFKYHKGKRKDGFTPEFDHQITMALFSRTLPDVMFPEELICTILLHDVREDYDITDHEVRKLFEQQSFSTRVSLATECFTKVFRGVKKEPTVYFAAIAEDPIASIGKGIDRVHNHQTMNTRKLDGTPAFTYKKQQEYIAETKEYFLPMLKVARKNFPRQHNAYLNLKFILTSQIELIECIHRVADPT
jgi:(p)ppGpp synthase/HD superfamily hydrolase